MWSSCLLDLGVDFSLVTWSFYEMCSILLWHLISMACIFLWSSAVRVPNSQAYRKMDLTRECISCILELREIHLLSQTGFDLVFASLDRKIISESNSRHAIHVAGTLQATAGFKDSDSFQKAIKMVLRCILSAVSHLSGFSL